MGDLFPAFSMIFFRRLGWIFVPVFLVSSFGLILSVLEQRQPPDAAANPVTIAIPIAFCLFFLFALPYFSARSALKSSKVIQGTVHYRFSENGMDSTAQGAYGHN